MGAWRAVKFVHRRDFDHDRPFERELSGIQRFEPISRSHPSQLNILHVGRGPDCFYYVMELADDQGNCQVIDEATYCARTLRSELLQRGHIPYAECLELGIALATALQHLHQNDLVHRDIKPSNIVFVNGIPKLADIGLVAHAEAIHRIRIQQTLDRTPRLIDVIEAGERIPAGGFSPDGTLAVAATPTGFRGGSRRPDRQRTLAGR